MSRQPAGEQVNGGAAPEEPLAVLRSLALSRAAAWFPELDERAFTVHARTVSTRPRSTVVLLTVSDGHIVQRAVAKLRRGDGGRSDDAARPGVVPQPLRAGEQSALEYRALRSIQRMIEPAEAGLGAVRPLEHVPALAGLVMGHLDAPTGRQTLGAASRFGLLQPRRHLARRVPDLFRNAGVWLRRFHATTGDYELAERLTTREEVESLVLDFAAYLEERVGPAAADLARRAGSVVPAALPVRMALAVGHGDFAVRNAFLDLSGRLYVIDPMPRWRVPVLEDLARFMVSVRLQGLQVNSQGLAYGARFLDERERDFLAGYYDAAPPPWRQLHSYQLVVLFDKWSALVSQRSAHPGVSARFRTAGVDRYVLGEGRRLLNLVEAGR